jgi:hyperosmotically inducible protein
MYIGRGILGTLFVVALVVYLARRRQTLAAHHDARAFRGTRTKLFAMIATLVASGTFVSAAIADETAKSDMSHADTYVKDSVITTKVKAKLAEKHLSTLTNIQVDTDSHGIVWLSGKAPTQDASDLAVMIAKSTEGVISVHNKIVVEE